MPKAAPFQARPIDMWKFQHETSTSLLGLKRPSVCTGYELTVAADEMNANLSCCTSARRTHVHRNRTPQSRLCRHDRTSQSARIASSAVPILLRLIHHLEPFSFKYCRSSLTRVMHPAKARRGLLSRVYPPATQAHDGICLYSSRKKVEDCGRCSFRTGAPPPWLPQS